MKELHLRQGLMALVPEEKLEEFQSYRWHIHRDVHKGQFKTRYAYTFDHPAMYMHRIVMGLEFGDGILVDHRDGNGLNNDYGNLRLCNRAQNQHNADKHQDNTSGFKGVWRRTDRKGPKIWRASIKSNGLLYRSNHFSFPQEAAKWRDMMAILLHGEFARLNFQEMKDWYIFEISKGRGPEIPYGMPHNSRDTV